MRRITNSLLLILACLLAPLVAHAQSSTAGSVNLRAIGGTTVPSGLVDTNGIKIQCVVGCGGAAAFTDNSAFTGGTSAVTPIGALYDTTPPAVADGNAGVPRMDASRYLYVNCIVGCSGSSFADNSAFTAGTSAITNLGGVFNDGLAAVTSGNAAAARITDRRGLHVNLRNNTGSEVGTSGAPVRVDPTGTTTQPVSGTVAISGTVTVSGTVTANQGGSPWNMRLQDGSGATLAAVTAGNALKTDGSAVTQPVSGTVTVTDGAGALNVIVDSSALPSGASTLAEQQTQTTALQLIDDVVHASDAAASKGSLMACQFDDTAPGTTTENNVRFLRCSTRREAYTQIRDAAGNERGANVNASNAMLVAQTGELPAGTQNIGDVDIASLPNEGQQTMANSISVTLASDQQVPDPCTFRAKSYAPVNISTATTTQLVAASASNKLYVCAFHLITNAANNVAFVEDDTAACASPTAGIVGGTTAATGYILTAGSGLTLGSGSGSVAQTAATNRYVCLITSAATQLTGGLSYVLAP